LNLSEYTIFKSNKKGEYYFLKKKIIKTIGIIYLKHK